MRKTATLLLITAFVLLSAASGLAGSENRFVPLVESYARGWIDWDEGAIYGIGRGELQRNGGSHPKARRAAKITSLQSILKIAAGIHVGDGTTIEDLSTGSQTIELEALIRFTVHRERWIETAPRPYYETVLRAPLNGIEGLSARLYRALKNRPLQRNRPPSSLPDEDKPWLVLDARRAGRTLPVSPALFPRIVTESGKTLYDISRVEQEALVARGMARYLTPANRTARRIFRTNPPATRTGLLNEAPSATVAEPALRPMPGKYMVMEVASVRGAANTTFVLSAENARSIEAEDAFSRILKRCRVIVVVPRPSASLHWAPENARLQLRPRILSADPIEISRLKNTLLPALRLQDPLGKDTALFRAPGPHRLAGG